MKTAEETVYGECGKHPGNNMVNCQLCKIERMDKEINIIKGLTEKGLLSLPKKTFHAKPQFYSLCFEQLKNISLKYGYNLVIHGSMNRDFDLIAIPWQENVLPFTPMLDEFVDYLGGHILPEKDEDRQAFANKYNGRMSYVINLNRGGKKTNYEDPEYYIDISIMPPATPANNTDELIEKPNSEWLKMITNKIEKSVEPERHVLSDTKGYHFDDVLQCRTRVNMAELCIAIINDLIPKEAPKSEF